MSAEGRLWAKLPSAHGSAEQELGLLLCRAGDISAAQVSWLPQKFCYHELCVYLGAAHWKSSWCSHLKASSDSRSAPGDLGSLCWLSVSCRSSGKGFLSCPADVAVQVLTFLPGLENNSFVPVAVCEPKSGQSS